MAEPEEQKLICGYSIQCLYFHRQYHSTCWVRPRRPGLAAALQGGVSDGSHVRLHLKSVKKVNAKPLWKDEWSERVLHSSPLNRHNHGRPKTWHLRPPSWCSRNSQGYRNYWHSAMGAAPPPVQAEVFDTCLLTQHPWVCRFADVERWYSVVV